ncbi:MAG: hypothetical protein ACI9MJ_002220, partial [Alphaproteobacteria bacterium]
MDSSFLGIPDMDATVFYLLALASFCTALFGMVTGAG